MGGRYHPSMSNPSRSESDSPVQTPTTPPSPAVPIATGMMSKQEKINLLKELTQVPTAAGKEGRVVAFIEQFVASRPEILLAKDVAGNLTLSFKPKNRAERKSRGRDDFAAIEHRPVFITAHLDHPAFVVEKGPSAENGGAIELSFRGGVMEVFFDHAPITIHTKGGAVEATLTGQCKEGSAAGKHYTAEVDGSGAAAIEPGDIATWRLGPAEVDDKGVLHTHACDDLAAAAAALCAFDDLRMTRARNEKMEDVRLLFTRSEEIGFIGAIAACRLGTLPKGARVIALENSRSFVDSPIGGGPIVRVGDRISIFTPWLTAACCKRAEEAFGGPSLPKASETNKQGATRVWQRKLMAGGACEASVFCHFGFAATCICLPLGNYHNMQHLDALQMGTYDAMRLGPPRCGHEYIHTQDFLGLVDLLVAIGKHLPESGSSEFGATVEKLYAEKKYVIGSYSEPEPEKKREGGKASGIRHQALAGKKVGTVQVKKVEKVVKGKTGRR